jgi:hypothetical protein
MQNIIRDTGTAKGRGVFAARAYSAGEIVEVAPVIPLAAPFKQIPRELQLIVFTWKDKKVAMSLGYGSMYNHDNPANLSYEADFDNDTIEYIAERDIAEGEELTINYNSDGAAEWPDDGWFIKNRIKRI